MASVEVTINGVIYDKLYRTTRPAVIIGEASLTGLGVGGGPIIPPDQGQPPDAGGPPGIWGPPGPWPVPPIANVPGLPPMGPIYPPNVPPGLQPPTPPNPGDPTTPVPGDWPVNPVTPPAYMVVNYPGIGPVYVAPPVPGRPQTAKK